MSARSDWSVAGGNPAARAAGYGIPGVTVDGMDMFAINAQHLRKQCTPTDPVLKHQAQGAALASPLAVYLGLSLFVTYMGQRNAIREVHRHLSLRSRPSY